MCREIICVTNRHLCTGDFLERIREITEYPVSRLILREKDLPEYEYLKLAEKVCAVCEKNGVAFIPHTYIKAARLFNCKNIHLPFSMAAVSDSDYTDLKPGFSIHSLEQAGLAMKSKACYLTAGHIYATDCKKNLSPRGTEFLREIVEKTSVPVYAIGGITPENIREIYNCGASGACIMSGFMQGDNFKSFFID